MFKVGDRVVLNDFIKEYIKCYTNEVFTIISIKRDIAILDKCFNGYETLHINHLRYSIKEDRLLKLKKLGLLCSRSEIELR